MAWAVAHGYGRYAGQTSLKGTAEIDWSDAEQRRRFLGGIVADADRRLEQARVVRSGVAAAGDPGRRAPSGRAGHQGRRRQGPGAVGANLTYLAASTDHLTVPDVGAVGLLAALLGLLLVAVIGTPGSRSPANAPIALSPTRPTSRGRQLTPLPTAVISPGCRPSF
jgi:hypothetical protein